MGKQVWIPDWISKNIPIESPPSRFSIDKRTEIRKAKAERNTKLLKNFTYWMKWWDKSYNGTGTYDEDILASNLGYAIEDLDRGVVR